MSFRLNRRTVLRLLATSLSPFGLTMLNTVTLVVINRGALAYGGSLAVACYAVMSYAICMVHFIIQGIGDGGAAPSQPVLRRRRTGGAGSGPYTDLPFRPAAALLCGIALFLGRSAIPHLFGASNAATRLFQVILPLFLLYLPFMSVVRILTSYFCATEQITRADLLIYGQPVVLVALSLILPRTGLGLSGVWLSVPLTQILLAGAGVLLLHTAHAGTKPIPAAAPPAGRPLRLSVCVTWMPTGPYPKNGCAPSFREGAQLFLFIAKISTLSGSAPPAPPLVPLSPARRSKIAPNASVPPYQDTSAEAKCVHNSSRSSRLSIKAR